MKKLLGILVISLFVSTQVLSKEIIIECSGAYSDGVKYKNSFIIDDRKKTWRMPRQIEPWDVFIINDKVIGRLTYFTKGHEVCFSNNRCSIGHHRLNRYTGEYLSIFADVKKSELLKFHKDTGMFESDEKFFKRAGLFIVGQIIADPGAKKDSIWEESQCKAGDKKF